MTDYEMLLAEARFNYKNINIYRKDSLLYIANGLCERTVDLAQGYPSTVSLKNSRGTEFAKQSAYADFSFIGINMPTSKHSTDYEITEVTVKQFDASLFDAEHVRVNITVNEKIEQVTFIRSYLIYTNLPVIAVENSISSKVSPNIYWSHRGGLNELRNFPVDLMESSVDIISLNKGVKPIKTVEFQGRTDYTNDLVIEQPAKVGGMNGNLLFCEHDNDGFLLLQEAPPSRERRDFDKYDFRLTEDNRLFSCCWGIPPEELTPKQSFSSYRHVIVFYSKGQEQLMLKRYLKHRFPQNPAKDYSITVNPWGVGDFPSLVNEQFLVDEIAASKAIGATHYQIDDGWQSGHALQELVLNNRNITTNFWTISEPHLPDGFKHIYEAAKQHNIELALWFAPSYNCEYRDWKTLADILFDFYQKYAIRMFKIDAVITRTKLAEDNLEQLVKSLRERSAGDIIFNFDTTNGQRPGYFMFLEYGNIFLENRYVYGFGIGYHPEDTLNNFWTLAQYMRAQTLQIEIPAHEAVNDNFYIDRNQLPPNRYSAEYWAAIALFANPLLWFAPSVISKELTATYRKIMDLHLEYRERIFAGEISPIGQEPNGSAITGFIAHNEATDSGMMILFRELNSSESVYIDIHYLNNKRYSFTTIYASARTIISHDTGSKFHIFMESPASFCLLEYW